MGSSRSHQQAISSSVSLINVTTLAGMVAQHAKLLLVMPATCIRVLVSVPFALLLFQLSTNVLGMAVEDDLVLGFLSPT